MSGNSQGSDYNTLYDLLQRVLESGGSGGRVGGHPLSGAESTDFDSTMAAVRKSIEKMIESNDKYTASLKGLTEDAKKLKELELQNLRITELSMKRQNESASLLERKNVSAKAELDLFTKLKEQLKQGKINQKDFNQATKYSVDALQGLSDSTDEATKKLAKKAINELKNSEIANEAFKRIFGDGITSATALKNYISTAFNATKMAGAAAGSLVKEIQGGAGGVSVGVSLMTSATDIAAKGAAASARAIGELGSALPVVGGLFKGVGMAAAAVIEATNEILKFSLDLGKIETEKLIKSYGDAASVGAIFADGMGELSTTVAGSGLSINHFTEMTKNNAENLAKAGFSTGEGLKKLVSVFKTGGDTFKSHCQILVCQLKTAAR